MAQSTTARFLLGATVLLGLAGCHRLGYREHHHADVAAAKQALAAIEANWNQAFHAKNLDALVAPYGSDAVFVLPGLAPQVGTTAIRKTYADALKDPNFDVTLASDDVEVARSGDLGFTHGHFTMKGSDPKTKLATTTATGSYLTIFKKQPDGSWKAIQDWAAANPPPAEVKTK
jgi:uncharacterized protein (TIGR02246 family)